MKKPRYAIVDIETTGGSASASRITEIAIYIFDGKKVVEEYSSLVNPQQAIPFHIQALTGISDEMVENAPVFEDIAEDIYHLLGSCIFVAHNVHFDYSFVQAELKSAGYEWKAQRLCTVRLSRKIFKGLPSYSLGKLCQSLGIIIEDRHRAAGDAKATVTLFQKLYEADSDHFIKMVEQTNAKEQRLPTNIPGEVFNRLPHSTGIYLFKNNQGKVIYVGKAVNIKKRVISHFTGNNPGERRQHFINEISDIDFKESGTELMAFLMECDMIKKIWPIYNRALKKYDPKYGLISYEDQNGYLRLSVCQIRKHITPLYAFNTVLESTQFLLQLINSFALELRLCAFFNSQKGEKDGAEPSLSKEPVDVANYNEKVLAAIESLQNNKRSFVIVDRGRHEEEKSYIYFKENKVFALGFVQNDLEINDIEEVVVNESLVHSNFYMNNLAINYAKEHPSRVQQLTGIPLEEA
ncbi:DNA polymerase III subunit epsilon [Sphingobacterium sp. DK4209]|uniref:DNA polymerase III subunit epsilon n=1 Tax=Sphingobacterium zhuxiongii TaxID=2662364 RepID=A0A5Q0QBS5_9SPHI|nr:MULTISPECIES: exonuclease domain-containing protein [unclassified Sphingobacterium]MVZ67220.1 DNA polymerase III subunit epsilon [Sphingobacterium sp. DK4209]QGA26724.1 DNA polymerase III subunit epsilon [Sphingobacterium sp. dk4302]